MKKQTGRFYKLRLISVLTTDIFVEGKTPHYKSMVKIIKERKEYIFHKNDVPEKKMAPIHALILQLLAKGILALGVLDMTKIGKKKFSAAHVSMTLPTSMDGDIALPAYMIDSNWERMNYL